MTKAYPLTLAKLTFFRTSLTASNNILSSGRLAIVTGKINLKAVLANAKPEMQQGTFVFCTLADSEQILATVKPILTFREQEGMTIVIRREEERVRLAYQFASRLITLRVH